MLYMKQHQYAAHHAVYGNSMSYTAYYFTGIFYADVRQISMLFIDNKDSVFCKVLAIRLAQNFAVSKRQNFTGSQCSSLSYPLPCFTVMQAGLLLYPVMLHGYSH